MAPCLSKRPSTSRGRTCSSRCVTFTFAGLSDDASRFRIRNEISRDDGQLAARLTSLGGWFDLNLRKLVAPPEALVDALRALDRSDDFEKLESSLRK